MATYYTRIRLNGGNRCKRVETSKAYALKLRKEICFIPKEYCKMYDLDSDNIKWMVDIPEWLISKSEKVREFVQLIQQENEHRYKEIDNS